MGWRMLKGRLWKARADFNLNTQASVLQFIANDGLDKPEFINSKCWKNNPLRMQGEIMVDAWSFFSGYTRGYIAFFQSSSGPCSWIIKSFKRDDKRNERKGSRSLTFAKKNRKLH